MIHENKINSRETTVHTLNLSHSAAGVFTGKKHINQHK